MSHHHNLRAQAATADAPLIGYPAGQQREGGGAGANTERRESRGREVMLAQTEFNWLKDYQHHAPAPRIDLRYHAEGAISLLSSSIELRQLWLQCARQALLDHLQQDVGAEGTRISGTAQPSGSREGAQARTQGQAEGQDRSRSTCRALHVGETTFTVLKSLQDSTPDPRIGMRYLLEGAVRVLQLRADLHRAWVGHARRALQAHLAHLQAAG